MRRRDFIAALGGAAVWPWDVRAQPLALPVIGLLGSESPDLWAARMRVFHQGLSETGFIDGRNVAIEYRWAEGHNDRRPALAADLVRRRVAVIAAPGSTPAALAAKAATSTIPIIFWIGGDAVQLGLVASLNRPEGNISGLTTLNVLLGPKRLELLHELIPTASDFALLVNPTDRTNAEIITRDVLRTGEPSRGAHGLPISRVRRGRRPYELWRQYYGCVPRRWHLHRPYPQR